MSYHVEITETIVEVRSYEIDGATSAKDAAEIAYNTWVVNGINPEDGISLEVSDRTYTVDGNTVEVECDS